MRDEPYILLIEDSPDDVQLALHAFRSHGTSVPIVVQEDGAAAIEFIASDACAPLLVLLDLNLPKIRGIDVLKAIRASKKTLFVPVIVLTTSSEERDVVESYSAGANSYIVKPVDFDRFRATISAAIRYWLEINESAPPCRRLVSD